MNASPLLLFVSILGGLYFAKLWCEDFRAGQRAGTPLIGGLPGATPAPPIALAVAALGGMVIVAGETWGELALGIAGEQSTITWLAAGYTLVAAVVEEIIFRGYLVVPARRGPWLGWAGVVAASVLFAALHPFLWQWEDGEFTWTINLKGGFSTAAVLVSSLWFYAMRLGSLNPQRSLLPCFAAHGAKNLGVIAVKLAQGFVVGLW